MTAMRIPILPIGPGTQPGESDGAELDVLSMPQAMSTYAAPELPEPEEIVGLLEAIAVLRQVLERLDAVTSSPVRMADAQPDRSTPLSPRTIDLTHLDAANRTLVDQTLGEGEVAIIAGEGLHIQEAVLAGVWRIQQRLGNGYLAADAIEIGVLPGIVVEKACRHVRELIEFSVDDQLPPGLQNGPSLVAELNTAIASSKSATQPHVINLSLLPHTPDDLLWLGEKLGRGSVTILSRGYGNCRIVSTGTRNVWWVQYFNSQDQLILNTLEVAAVPVVACASKEDLEDSLDRFREILQVIQ